jgi:hypothetical protein
MILDNNNIRTLKNADVYNINSLDHYNEPVNINNFLS